MTEFAAEDFAQATFARHEEGGVAARLGEAGIPWRLSSGVMRTDAGMAHNGWEPVMELGQSVEESIRDLRVSRDTQNLVIESYREREDRLRADVRGQAAIIGELRERLQAADDVKDMLRGTVEDLREKVKQLEATQQSPLSLADLEAAWEAAGQSDTCNQGDVLIVRDALDVFTVWVAPARHRVDADTRILSRAPQREPWQDLADVIREQSYHPEPNSLAQALHAAGVRVTGGDES